VPVCLDSEALRGSVGQVDQAVIDERPAIVDLDDDGATVVEIDDLGVGRQWQGLVRGGHREHVIGLAAGGAAAVKLGAVPGCDASFDIAVAGREHVIAPVEDLVGRWIAVAAERLYLRHCVRHARNIDRPRRRAVTRFALLERRERAAACDQQGDRIGGGFAQQRLHFRRIAICDAYVST
jgi:hypothetical protein